MAAHIPPRKTGNEAFPGNISFTPLQHIDYFYLERIEGRNVQGDVAQSTNMPKHATAQTNDPTTKEYLKTGKTFPVVFVIVVVLAYMAVALPLDDDFTDSKWNPAPSDPNSFFLLKKLKLKKLLLGK
ncbi:hypothetical protein J437_LFUL011256 [Ladona fulva]|uniref:Transmembrane protein n=1 Tax=Ladona fulva TaxID=123851 RepID=A0A8K0KCK4_LADFU|nr:hypothetical protein J437_LFUL011256 [Ladona fulva]